MSKHINKRLALLLAATLIISGNITSFAAPVEGSTETEPIVSEESEAVVTEDFLKASELKDFVISYGAVEGYIGTDEKVEIPNGVINIADDAFLSDETTKEVYIPASVRFISPNAFTGAQNIEKVVVDEANEDYASVDGIVYSKNMEELIYYPIKHSESEYVFPKSLKYLPCIESDGYYYCVLYGADAVKKITINKEFTDTRALAPFLDTMRETTEIEVAEGNEEFVARDKVVYSEGGTCLYYYPAAKPDESFDVPEGVTKIDIKGYRYQDKLKKINIGKDVISLGADNYSLHKFYEIASINVDPENPKYSSKDGVLYSKSGKTLIQYPQGAVPENGVVKIGSDVTQIGYAAFQENYHINSVKLPSKLKKIGHAAFMSSSIKSISIPDSVTSIGEDAFAVCLQLEKVKLSENITKIPEYAFFYSEKLASINIPQKVKTIGGRAFSGCGELKSIKFGKKVESIGKAAFYDCKKLKKITFLGNAPQIANSTKTEETGAFIGVKATAYYPAGNTTWTAKKRVNYGGKLTWKAK